MSTRADRDARVLDIVVNRLGIDIPDAETDLIETGMMDSLGLVTLIAGLEEAFACELPLDDFDLDDFRSIRRITGFLDSSGILDTRGPW